MLGVTAGEGSARRCEHDAFVVRHRERLAGTTDDGLLALLAFSRWLDARQFTALGWPEDMKDQNVVFALESERLDGVMIHDRPAARDLWARLIGSGR